MDREIKLSFGDDLDLNKETKEVIVEEEENAEEVVLTDEEKKQIEDFADQIDIKNSNLVLQYGAQAQKQIADFSEKTLETVKTKDLGEIGDLLTGVVNEVKNFDIDEDAGIITKFIKKSANKAQSIQAKYAKAENNIDTIVKALDAHQIQLLKDIEVLDQMYELNQSYYKELTMYILAGRKKLPTDAQKINDYESAINRFDKKLHDLDLTRMVSLQMAPQIRMVQASNTVMVEKIQSTIVNTIPLWKSQMVIAMGATHSMQAAKTQKAVTDLTNDLLRKNAEALHMSTVETAKASERSIVDIDTIRHTNEELVAALREVRDIQIEGAKQREKASAELVKIEEELKNSLMDIAKNR